MIKKMKIAIVTDAIYPFTLGGSEIRNHEIARRLIKKGHEVHIYGGKFWKGDDEKIIDGVRIFGVSKYKSLYGKNSKRSVFEPLKLSIKLFFRFLKEDYDIIDVATFVYFNCYTMKLALMINNKSKLVFTWHQYFGDYLISYFGRIKGTVGKIIERGSVGLTKNNLAVSEHVKSELIKRGVDGGDVEVIYNGADIGMIDEVKSQGEEFDVIFVGRLNYQKNLSLLIKSVALIKKEFPEVKVGIVGGGVDRENLISLTKKLGLEKNIKFLGEIKDKSKVFRLMKSAKVFALPSILEGFPLTIIESNACGLPIITTKTKYNNTKEYIKNNENGLLVKPNPDDFSKAILKLLKSENLRKEMSKKGIKKAQCFDWDKIAEEQEGYYLGVINKDSINSL